MYNVHEPDEANVQLAYQNIMARASQQTLSVQSRSPWSWLFQNLKLFGVSYWN